MYISAREVARMLEDVGLSRPQAAKVMAAGLAGTPLVTRGATLYEESVVERLTEWPRADETLVDRTCPSGLFIARRAVDTRDTEEQQRADLRPGWAFSPYTGIWLRERILREGFFPLVATIGGFVVCGADITDVLPHQRSRRLDLRAPSGWFSALAEHRLEAGPGSPWAIRGWQLRARRVGRSERQLQPRPQPPRRRGDQ